MTQPPQPPNQPPQGGFGAPQDPPPNPPGHHPQQGQNPPSFEKAPEPGYGYPQQPGQAPGTPPPPAGAPAAPPPPAGPPATPPPPAGAPVPPPPPAQQPTQISQQPTMIAGQSAYGYPGGPGSAPPPPPGTVQGGQPGYGYPGQQPGGYAQPNTVLTGGQGPGGGKKISPVVWIITAAVAAMALIIGGGVLYANSSDDGKDEAGSSSGGTDGGKGGEGEKGGYGGEEKVPSDPSAKVSLQIPQPEVPKDEVRNVSGSWLNDKIYAKSSYAEVKGYALGTGKESWTLPLKGETCGGSKELSADGVAVVLHAASKKEKYNPCTEVTAFDLNDGSQKWTKHLDVSDQPMKFEEVTIVGDTVAAGSGLSGGAAWDVKTGKKLWSPNVGDSCEDVGYAGGEQLVALYRCGSYGDYKYEIQRLNPKDGSPLWKYPLAAGVDNAKVISTKPVVVGVDSGEQTLPGTSDVFSFDDAGKLRFKISLDPERYSMHRCEVNKVYSCSGIVVGSDKLYVPTEEHEGTGGKSYERTNEVVAFSLATGKLTGDRMDGGNGYKLFPMRMDGTNLLAYKSGPYDKGHQVVSIDSKTMKQTKLLETTDDRQVLRALIGLSPDRAELRYRNGHMFLSEELISKPSAGSEFNYLGMGFSRN
ncbi:outer membrane protein assembly factor BamB family protein [Streptomyces physcomitrii]|uniref:PQQ-like beta-propeller repeat protein n=1 Tax=Streptomyces physcomitrii TaxID=2724184 RepID=A0ABX1GXF0_9ACTN|nr:PQQ-binding-like beta-propeller repeat protein [Streptomyces physcomitrii]NKI40779.1 PQQ-like beta-propeller repeat protein [Streptomyces physcomitrii]